MDWHLKTTEKELLNAFTSFLSQKYHLFSQKQLYIWGASVRGTLLGMLMEDRGWKDFSYLDNDTGVYAFQPDFQVIKENVANIFMAI